MRYLALVLVLMTKVDGASYTIQRPIREQEDLFQGPPLSRVVAVRENFDVSGSPGSESVDSDQPQHGVSKAGSPPSTVHHVYPHRNLVATGGAPPIPLDDELHYQPPRGGINAPHRLHLVATGNPPPNWDDEASSIRDPAEPPVTGVRETFP